MRSVPRVSINLLLPLLTCPPSSVRPPTHPPAHPSGVMREIAVMKKMDHPHLVRLHEVIDPPDSAYMMMVMEYIEKGAVLETKGQSGFKWYDTGLGAFGWGH